MIGRSLLVLLVAFGCRSHSLAAQSPRVVSAATLGRVSFDGWRARLVAGADTFSFQLGSPFFQWNARHYQLAAPVTRSGNSLLLPPQFLSIYQRTSPQPPQPAPPQPQARSVEQAKPPQARIVVLDAGHGGRDPGKPGPNGVLEKNAALAIVNALAGFLRQRGYEVHLTRSTDTLIALADRPHLANQWKNNRPAAVFVSVHANSGVSSARGFETYFLSEARTEDERRVAEMENEAVKYETKGEQKAPDLDLIVSGLKNDFYLRASNGLAELIQQNLATVHPGPNRGVKQAGFRVLVGALMPAVLVETAFISNREEATLLGTSAFQQKLAFSLAAAIDKFFDTHAHFFAVPQ